MYEIIWTGLHIFNYVFFSPNPIRFQGFLLEHHDIIVVVNSRKEHGFKIAE